MKTLLRSTLLKAAIASAALSPVKAQTQAPAKVEVSKVNIDAYIARLKKVKPVDLEKEMRSNSDFHVNAWRQFTTQDFQKLNTLPNSHDIHIAMAKAHAGEIMGHLTYETALGEFMRWNYNITSSVRQSINRSLAYSGEHISFKRAVSTFLKSDAPVTHKAVALRELSNLLQPDKQNGRTDPQGAVAFLSALHELHAEGKLTPWLHNEVARTQVDLLAKLDSTYVNRPKVVEQNDTTLQEMQYSKDKRDFALFEKKVTRQKAFKNYLARLVNKTPRAVQKEIKEHAEYYFNVWEKLTPAEHEILNIDANAALIHEGMSKIQFYFKNPRKLPPGTLSRVFQEADNYAFHETQRTTSDTPPSFIDFMSLMRSNKVPLEHKLIAYRGYNEIFGEERLGSGGTHELSANKYAATVDLILLNKDKYDPELVKEIEKVHGKFKQHWQDKKERDEKIRTGEIKLEPPYPDLQYDPPAIKNSPEENYRSNSSMRRRGKNEKRLKRHVEPHDSHDI